MSGHWTAADIEALRRQHAEGWSSGQSAAWFGRTRNAVIGKWQRLGLTRAGVQNTVMPRRPSAAEIAARPAMVRPRRAPKPAKIAAARPVPELATPGLDGLRIRSFVPLALPDADPAHTRTILTRRAGECAYALFAAIAVQGIDSPFCGRPTGSPAQSWCPGHRALVFDKVAAARTAGGDDGKRSLPGSAGRAFA